MWIIVIRSVLCSFLCNIVVVKPIDAEQLFLAFFLGLEKVNFFRVDLSNKCKDNFFDDGNDDAAAAAKDVDFDVVEVSNNGEQFTMEVFI